MLTAYREHVAERAALGLPPLPLSAEQTAELVDLIKNPPAGEEQMLLELLENRVPAGVDQAAYVKAAFLADIAKGEAFSSLVSPQKAIELMCTMLGGYNVQALVDLLDSPLGAQVAETLSHTILMFDAFHDVAEKVKAGVWPPRRSLLVMNSRSMAMLSACRTRRSLRASTMLLKAR